MFVRPAKLIAQRAAAVTSGRCTQTSLFSSSLVSVLNFFELKKACFSDGGLELAVSPVGLVLGSLLLLNVYLHHVGPEAQSLGLLNQLLVWSCSLGS